MLRTIFLAAIILCAAALEAQTTPLSLGSMYGTQPGFQHWRQAPDSARLQKKWFVTKYAALSTGFIGFNGGSATFLSAPMGIQLNRQLTNTVYAFAGLEISPTYLHYNGSFTQNGMNKGFMNTNSFNIYTTARMGLMYVNPDRTFSISGSIGVSRGYFNNYAPLYAPGFTPVYTPGMKDSRF